MVEGRWYFVGLPIRRMGRRKVRGRKRKLPKTLCERTGMNVSKSNHSSGDANVDLLMLRGKHEALSLQGCRSAAGGVGLWGI